MHKSFGKLELQEPVWFIQLKYRKCCIKIIKHWPKNVILYIINISYYMKSHVMLQQSVWGMIQHNYLNNNKKKGGGGTRLICYTILVVQKKKILWTQWKQMNICLRFLWIVLIFCSVFLHNIIYMLYNIYSITFITLGVSIYTCIHTHIHIYIMGLPYYIFISTVS